MAPKSGQSEREDKIKKGKLEEETIHKVPWCLKGGVGAVAHKAKRVQGELVFPSSVSKRRKGEWIHPHVMLDVYPENADTIHALTMMRDSTSTNILHASLVFKGVSNDILAWVEPFTGNLQECFKSNDLGIYSTCTANAKIVLPTDCLSSAVNQIVDGMGDLERSGHYHGNFSLVNTRYLWHNSGALTIKLCNFRKKKDGSYKTKLAEDWHAVAEGLEQIREIAKGLKTTYKNLDWCKLDGLIKLMKNIGACNVHRACEVIKQQPFFWGTEERTSFFIQDIPLALQSKHFVHKVKNAAFITLPWDDTDLDGLLHLMNCYRTDEDIEGYNLNCRVSFVRFISGVYTHEHELKPKRKVDITIGRKYSGLCYRLYGLLPHANSMPTT